MTSEEKSYRGCWWALIGLIVLSFVANIYFLSRTDPQPSVVIERDTVWRDSIIREPVPAETIDIGKTVYIKVPVPKYLPGDTVHDSIEVPIPIMQKRYDDSLYTAWVSGYEPNLDSIDLRLPTITETVTKTIVKPSPRLSVGIQAGAGVGVFSRQPDIYLGVGAQWRFWPK